MRASGQAPCSARSWWPAASRSSSAAAAGLPSPASAESAARAEAPDPRASPDEGRRPRTEIRGRRAECREAFVAVQQVAEEQRDADVAGEELVTASAERRALLLDLADRVHGESSRAVEPGSSPVRRWRTRKAYALPAVPWQRFEPFASGPACQVSSPPASATFEI